MSKLPLEYVSSRQPQRDSEGRLVFTNAQELTWRFSREFWLRKNEKMRRRIDVRDSQVVIIDPSDKDITGPFHTSVIHNSLGAYPTAIARTSRFPEGEARVTIESEAPKAKHVYIVSPLTDESSHCRVLETADHYKYDLNAQFVTCIYPYCPGREDKNVTTDEGHTYTSNARVVHARFQSMKGLVDRVLGIENHSGAAQVAAAEAGIPYAPFSPWLFMLNQLSEMGRSLSVASQNKKLFARPDEGRNIASLRAVQHFGLTSIFFQKRRIDEHRVEFYLAPDQEALAEGADVTAFDDEIGTAGTIGGLAQALTRYCSNSFQVAAVHPKFTGAWEMNIEPDVLKLILVADTRPSIGNIGSHRKIQQVSLSSFLNDLILADMQGVDFWSDPRYKQMILQANGKKEL